MINYDDFKKVEVKVGKILSVEEVPETDKLLKLTVDFGFSSAEAAEGEEKKQDIRQIVSGIKQKVADIQSLVGMSTTFVTNLEPRMIKGLESNGMLFAIATAPSGIPPTAGSGEQDFSFLVPASDVPPGSIAG